MANFVVNECKLDIVPQGNYPVVYLSQYEDGRDVKFHMLNRGFPLEIPESGISVFVSGLKANGGYFEHSCEVTDDSVVVMHVEADMTDISGRGAATLTFTDSDNKKVISAKFIINVQDGVSDGGIEIPTEAETIFQQLLDEIRSEAAKLDLDMDALDAKIEEFKSDVNADVTDFKEDVTSDMDSFKSDINDDIDTINARMDNFLASQTGVSNGERFTVTALYSAPSSGVSTYVSLSDDPINYPYLIISFGIYTTGTDGYRTVDRAIVSGPDLREATQANPFICNSFGVFDDALESGTRYYPLRAVQLSMWKYTTGETQYKAYRARFDTLDWSGTGSQDAYGYSWEGTNFTVKAIYGIKFVDAGTSKDPELADIRIGADGYSYPSAGAAVRSQILSVVETKYGSPLIATEADDMVEENRVYVYTGSESGYVYGHWYYYNGTEWADGGVYNSSAINTDTTLTQSGMAADSKAVGDEFSAINEDLSDEVTRATEEEGRIEALVESKPLPVAENITPIYVGDYLSPFNYLPSCCVRVGNYIYAIDSLLRGVATSSGSNAGKIRKFDLVNNVEIKSWEKTADVGHANSVAYDTVNEKFYVVPIWVYSVGEETDASFIYVFDSDFNPEGTVQTPSVAGRVSYDSVKNKLYYYDYHYKVFEYDGTDWTVASVIDLTGISENTLLGRTYNQDFAVYDGQFYLSSPYGMIVRGKLTPGTSHVDMCCITDYEDSNRRFILGELEGMEFSQDGHLYAVEYVTLSADIRNAFIVELPTSIVAPPSSNIDGPIFTAYDSTLTLSEATQSKFYLRTDEIRSILQLACRKFLSQSSAVLVPSGNNVTEPYPIRINRNLDLILTGQYTVNKFNVLSGTLSISSDVAANRLTFLTNETPITLSRNGGLKFAGAQPINVKLNNLSSGNGFIRTGYSKCLTSIRTVPVSLDNYSLRIGDSTELKYNNARYFGEDRLSENPAQVTLTYTSNNYVSRTAFNRLRLTQVSARFATLCINLVIDSGIIIPSSEVVIGSLNRTVDHEIIIVLAEQYGSGVTITMTIKQNGNIVIASYSSTKTGSSLCIFRGEVPIVLGAVYNN